MSSWALHNLSSKGRLAVISAILVIVVLGMTGFSSWSLYRTAIGDQKRWLLNLVATNAHLMNSMAQHERSMALNEQMHGSQQNDKTDFKLKFHISIKQILESKLEEHGIGKTGEFVLGKREGDRIVFMLPKRHGDHAIPTPVPIDSTVAEPMRRALNGKEGTVIALDYEKTVVLAAYAPIEEMGIGLVGKINLDEIRGPLIQTGIMNAVIATGILIMAVLSTLFLTRPIIHNLEKRTQELEASAESLKRSNTDLEQFAYVASHDLKAPLRGIDNLLGWLSADLQGRLEENEQRYIDLLHSRTERMEALLDGLLEYSRVGRKKHAPETIDTGAMIAAIAEFQAPPNSMRVTQSANMPTIHSPKVPLELVLRNLISNAVKHHDKDHGNIHIACGETTWWYSFTVHDDGPGIAPEYHDRIFGIFQTLKPRDEIEGSGIGLSLVKRTVEFYGGTVSVESDPSIARGTTIRFTWPKNIGVLV